MPFSKTQPSRLVGIDIDGLFCHTQGGKAFHPRRDIVGGTIPAGQPDRPLPPLREEVIRHVLLKLARQHPNDRFLFQTTNTTHTKALAMSSLDAMIQGMDDSDPDKTDLIKLRDNIAETEAVMSREGVDVDALTCGMQSTKAYRNYRDGKTPTVPSERLDGKKLTKLEKMAAIAYCLKQKGYRVVGLGHCDDEGSNTRPFNDQAGCFAVHVKSTDQDPSGLKRKVDQEGTPKDGELSDAFCELSFKAFDDFRKKMGLSSDEFSVNQKEGKQRRGEAPDVSKAQGGDETVSLKKILLAYPSLVEINKLTEQLTSRPLSHDENQARTILNAAASDNPKLLKREIQVTLPKAIGVMADYKRELPSATFSDPGKVLLAIKALRDAKHAGMGTRWFSSDKKRYQKFEDAYTALGDADKAAFKDIVHTQMRTDLNQAVRGVTGSATRTMKNVQRITGLSALPGAALEGAPKKGRDDGNRMEQ